MNGDAFASKKGVFVPLRCFSKCLAYSFHFDFLLFLLVVVEWLARLKSSFGVFAVGCGYFPHPSVVKPSWSRVCLPFKCVNLQHGER